MGLFLMKNASDMLEKAKRERQRMADGMDIDHVYNFFVTVVHVADYVRHSGLVSQVELDQFRTHPTFKLCRDLCDSGKHMVLTKQGRETPTSGVFENNMFRSPFGTFNFGPQTENWMVQSDGTWVSVSLIAAEIIALWDAFFKRHQLGAI